MKRGGTISQWNDEKGYGFISPDGGGERVFVHVTAFAGRGRRPVEKEKVRYLPGIDARGRPCVEQAWRDADTPIRFDIMLAFGVAGAFLGFVHYLEMIKPLPQLMAEFYLAMSVIACVMYAVDKAAAQAGKWRTAEDTLQLVALLGGWPGALVAQRLFRHKSRKTSFQFNFWITVALNCGALYWMTTPEGSAVIRKFLQEIF
ncbi:MAG: cold shock and DUF1294 domain-containing protein [Proteobacteria bacterium]|nr:cold shock and DUF1294 domain-containing protein [Pseudomonadota bacterium]